MQHLVTYIDLATCLSSPQSIIDNVGVTMPENCPLQGNDLNRALIGYGMDVCPCCNSQNAPGDRSRICCYRMRACCNVGSHSSMDRCAFLSHPRSAHTF